MKTLTTFVPYKVNDIVMLHELEKRRWIIFLYNLVNDVPPLRLVPHKVVEIQNQHPGSPWTYVIEKV